MSKTVSQVKLRQSIQSAAHQELDEVTIDNLRRLLAVRRQVAIHCRNAKNDEHYRVYMQNIVYYNEQMKDLLNIYDHEIS